MHEVSIAQGLLEIAIDNCLKGGYERIDSVRVKIGKASGVMPDSLLFAFEALKVGTIAEKAVLVIDEVPVSGFCNECKNEFSVDEAYAVTCPKCGGMKLRIDTGRELHIDEMEVN